MAVLWSSWFGSTHRGFWSSVRLELASTHIGTMGSWSSRAHTARMNTPETRSDKHTGPLLHHRTHPGNPGLNTDSLGEREREYVHVCIAFVFGWYTVLANTPTMHKINSSSADTDVTICMCLLRCHLLLQLTEKRQKWTERDSWFDLGLDKLYTYIKISLWLTQWQL